MQHKFDTLVNLKSFLYYAKNHFNKIIKFLRSENALEFDDSVSKQFFSDNGILHQSSYLYRPQQNARAERKHRHIFEIARSLRFHAGLPLNLWGACVMTSVHIINRLPTPILNNYTPFHKDAAATYMSTIPPSFTPPNLVVIDDDWIPTETTSLILPASLVTLMMIQTHLVHLILIHKQLLPFLPHHLSSENLPDLPGHLLGCKTLFFLIRSTPYPT